jgi:hypothetical protein
VHREGASENDVTVVGLGKDTWTIALDVWEILAVSRDSRVFLVTFPTNHPQEAFVWVEKSIFIAENVEFSESFR